MLFLSVFSKNLKTLDQRDPGVDHDGELTSKDGDVLRGGSAAKLQVPAGSRLLFFRVHQGDLLAPQRKRKGLTAVRGSPLVGQGRRAECRQVTLL